jgi:MoxR-like ATPase
VLRPLLAESDSGLGAAALEASASRAARAARIARAAEPLLELAPVGDARIGWQLRIEGLLREIDAGFPKTDLPEPLSALRERLGALLTAPG